MHNKRVIISQDLIDTFIKINRNKHNIMTRLDIIDDSNFNKYLKEELLKLHKSESYIVDVLIEYLYSTNSTYKETLWSAYGEYIYNNLLNNLGNTIQCENCTTRFEINYENERLCENCKRDNILKSKRIWKNGRKSKINNSMQYQRF